MRPDHSPARLIPFRIGIGTETGPGSENFAEVFADGSEFKCRVSAAGKSRTEGKATFFKSTSDQRHFLASVCGSLSRADACRSEEHTSELQSLMRTSYAVFCLQKTTYQLSQH